MPKSLKLLYVFQIALIGLLISGLIPRTISLYWATALSLVFIVSPLEQTVLFFVASIPLFVALPLTTSFDSLNMWRVLVLIIFAKWLFQRQTYAALLAESRLFLRGPWHYVKQHQLLASTLLLLLLAIISLVVAVDRTAGIKRIIYFINLSLIGIIVYDLCRRAASFGYKLLGSIRMVTLLVVITGFIQLISTYFVDIYQFMRFWGEIVELNLFGAQWSYIAVWKGNTWFAYFGDQLSLRMFSLFPDSHSFPVFVLLGLCALATGYILKKRSLLQITLICLTLLALILSGTRGIWAASVGVVLWSFAMYYLMRRNKIDGKHVAMFKRAATMLLLFFVLFTVAYPILASRQFRTPKDSDVIIRRIRSILDFGETSNGQRIEIWKATIYSITKHPLLGVGIYNFPVVLNQKILLGKAGSSAHNIYLHIAAELGLPALVLSLYIIYLILRRVYDNFIAHNNDDRLMAYNVLALLVLPWVFLYLLTDFALFDERAFMMFVTSLGFIFATKHE